MTPGLPVPSPIPIQHDVSCVIAFADLDLLATSGSLVNLGLVPDPHPINQMDLIANRLSFSGSIIGGIKNTQEVVDLCAAKGIYPKVEVVPVSQIHWVFEQLDSGNDGGVRYVLDLKNTLNESALAAGSAPPPEFVSIGAIGHGCAPKKASTPAKDKILQANIAKVKAMKKKHSTGAKDSSTATKLVVAAAAGSLVTVLLMKLMR